MIELDKMNVKLAQQKVNLQNSAIRNHNINIRKSMENGWSLQKQENELKHKKSKLDYTKMP